ncbi:hypothetical protein lerEdw1_016417 [Lerista edwardsae]|nr:hypothetical protein lerEdw1_016417 [Lerista edwardsae]
MKGLALERTPRRRVPSCSLHCLVNTVPTKLRVSAVWNLAIRKLGYDAFSPRQISKDALCHAVAQTSYREHSEMKLMSLHISGFDSWKEYVMIKMVLQRKGSRLTSEPGVKTEENNAGVAQDTSKHEKKSQKKVYPVIYISSKQAPETRCAQQ